MAQRHDLEEENGKWECYFPIFLIRKGSGNKFPWKLSRNHTLTEAAVKIDLCLTSMGGKRLRKGNLKSSEMGTLARVVVSPGFPTGLSKLGHTTVYEQRRGSEQRASSTSPAPGTPARPPGTYWSMGLTHCAGPGIDVPSYPRFLQDQPASSCPAPACLGN